MPRSRKAPIVGPFSLERMMPAYQQSSAGAVVLTLLLGAGCGSAGSSDASRPVATYNLAVFPGDFPEWETHWPAGEPIIAECWRAAPDTIWSEPSHVTVRTRAGERFAFTTALPPELLKLDGTIRQVASMFPDERSESGKDAEAAVGTETAIANDAQPYPWQQSLDETRRRIDERLGRPLYQPRSALFMAVQIAARAACR